MPAAQTRAIATTTSSAPSSLLRRLSNWKPSEPLPAAVDRSAIAAAVAELDKRLEPAGTKAATVLVDRLFRAVPKPPADALPIWIEKLKPHPAPVVAYAVERLIETWRYPNPPQIGDALALIKEDATYRSLRTDRARLTQALAAPSSQPQTRVSPEKLAALAASLPQSPERQKPKPLTLAPPDPDAEAAARLSRDQRERFWTARMNGASTTQALADASR